MTTRGEVCRLQLYIYIEYIEMILHQGWPPRLSHVYVTAFLVTFIFCWNSKPCLEILKMFQTRHYPSLNGEYHEIIIHWDAPPVSSRDHKDFPLGSGDPNLNLHGSLRAPHHADTPTRETCWPIWSLDSLNAYHNNNNNKLKEKLDPTNTMCTKTLTKNTAPNKLQRKHARSSS